MQSASLIVLSVLGILLRIAVLARCVRRGELRRYGFFCLMVTYGLWGAAYSTLAMLGATSSNAYRAFWDNTRWLEATIDAAAAIEAFWALARHFRNIRNFGWALISVIVAVSAGAAGIVGLLRVNWSSSLRGGFLLGQFINFALLLTALLSVAFFHQFKKIPVRPNAILHLRALGLLYGTSSAGYFIGQMTGAQWPFLTVLVIISSPIAAYLWWWFGIKPAGEQLPFEAPVMSDEEYETAAVQDQRTADQLKQAADQALEKTFGSSRNSKPD